MGMMTALIVWMVATFVALQQSPQRDTERVLSGMAWWLSPIEVNPGSRLQPLTGELNSIEQVGNSKTLWAVGEQGLMLWSDDLGFSWQQHRWLLDQQRPMDRSSDGGSHFQLINRAMAASPDQKFPKNAARNYVDFDREMQKQQAIPRLKPLAPNLQSIFFINEREGWLVGDRSTLFKTENGGLSWTALEGAPEGDLRDIVFFGSEEGLLVSAQGVVYQTTTGGQRWERLANQASILPGFFIRQNKQYSWMAEQRILDVSFRGIAENSRARGYRGLAAFNNYRDLLRVGNDLHFRVSAAGELSVSEAAASVNEVFDLDWAPVFQTTLKDQAPINEAAANNQVAVNKQVAINNQDDFEASQMYRKFPAPWYWLLTLCVLVGVFFWALRRQPVILEQSSITDIFTSDRPLKPGDPDPLNFGAIARALSRFMRNPNTEPPLTIAVTGEWGSGKSSLMNLLYHDLKQFGFSPVWFNAWHHQKGDQLLASLYANIKAQALPPWSKVAQGVPVGLLFRLQLLRRRAAQKPLLYFAVIVIFVSAITYLFNDPSSWNKLDISIWISSLANITSDGDLQRNLMVALFGMVPPLAGLVKALQAFGVDPLRLISSGSRKDKKETPDPSARFLFAKDFAEVSQSLELGRVVIFIDDLDRCSHENVLEIMEAINFLAVSGQCYIVLGMAKTWVKTCIALGFKELAMESLKSQEGHSRLTQHTDDQVRRKQFAEHYLEKLINIEVPVPKIEQGDFKALLMSDTQLKSETKQSISESLDASVTGSLLTHLSLTSRISSFVKRLTSVKQYGLTLGVVCAVALGIYIGTGASGDMLNFMNGSQLNGTAAVTNADDAAWNRDTNRYQDKASDPVNQMDTRDSSKRPGLHESLGLQPTPYADSQTHSSLLLASPRMMISLIAVSLLLIIGICWYWLRRPQRIEQDSKSFQQALAVWQPWIQWHNQTPRAVKRYLNRVRYLAMRNREGQPVAETDLVAMAAISALNAEWVDHPGRFEQLMSDPKSLLMPWLQVQLQKQRLSNEALEQSVADWVTVLSKSVYDHRRLFSSHVTESKTQQTFSSMASEVKV